MHASVWVCSAAVVSGRYAGTGTCRLLYMTRCQTHRLLAQSATIVYLPYIMVLMTSEVLDPTCCILVVSPRFQSLLAKPLQGAAA